jgi:hypothetical protein
VWPEEDDNDDAVAHLEEGDDDDDAGSHLQRPSAPGFLSFGVPQHSLTPANSYMRITRQITTAAIYLPTMDRASLIPTKSSPAKTRVPKTTWRTVKVDSAHARNKNVLVSVNV